jgi:hypothetical protein
MADSSIRVSFFIIHSYKYTHMEDVRAIEILGTKTKLYYMFIVAPKV